MQGVLPQQGGIPCFVSLESAKILPFVAGKVAWLLQRKLGGADIHSHHISYSLTHICLL